MCRNLSAGEKSRDMQLSCFEQVPHMLFAMEQLYELRGAIFDLDPGILGVGTL